MKENPLVSVIIPVFNTGKFITQAIESVFAQSYKNWELLIVDDGSTDDSTAIAQNYVRQFPGKVRYLEHDNHQNLGLSVTRNLGIWNAKGKYLTFLDADDIWLPQKLNEQVNILESEPSVTMVYGRALYWRNWKSNSNGKGRDHIQDIHFFKDTIVYPPELLPLYLRNEGITPCPSCIMVRTEIAKHIGGFEESFRGMYEDQAFYAKLILNNPVFIANRLWCKYRQHPNSITSTDRKIGVYWKSRIYFLKWLENYLDTHNMNLPEIREVLNQELQRAYSIQEPQDKNSQNRMVKQFILRPLKGIARNITPVYLSDKIRKAKRQSLLRISYLWRLRPVRRNFGYGYGQCIDRYYIENFLAQHADDIQGHVLELKDNTYTCRFGGKKVTRSDVLDVSPDNSQATIVADLTSADHIQPNMFDCIILTQTLHVIYDVQAALRTLYRTLKPGGVLLASFPGITQISRYDMEHWGDYWRFTTVSIRKLFKDFFPADSFTVSAHGNVLTSIAFLHGLVSNELRKNELDYCDPDYEMVYYYKGYKANVAVKVIALIRDVYGVVTSLAKMLREGVNGKV